MKPNHFRVSFTENEKKTSMLSVFALEDLTSEQYHAVGNTLLSLGRKLEPDKIVKVELMSLEDDGGAIFVYN